MNDRVREVLQVTGYLLETNATIRREARTLSGKGVQFDHTDACRWCLTGALNVVAKKLKVDDVKVFQAAADLLEVRHGEYTRLAIIWDNRLWDGRARIVDKLKGA